MLVPFSERVVDCLADVAKVGNILKMNSHLYLGKDLVLMQPGKKIVDCEQRTRSTGNAKKFKRSEFIPRSCTAWLSPL